jgi:hypothetical protein
MLPYSSDVRRWRTDTEQWLYANRGQLVLFSTAKKPRVEMLLSIRRGVESKRLVKVSFTEEAMLTPFRCRIACPFAALQISLRLHGRKRSASKLDVALITIPENS